MEPREPKPTVPSFMENFHATYKSVTDLTTIDFSEFIIYMICKSDPPMETEQEVIQSLKAQRKDFKSEVFKLIWPDVQHWLKIRKVHYESQPKAKKNLEEQKLTQPKVNTLASLDSGITPGCPSPGCPSPVKVKNGHVASSLKQDKVLPTPDPKAAVITADFVESPTQQAYIWRLMDNGFDDNAYIKRRIMKKFGIPDSKNIDAQISKVRRKRKEMMSAQSGVTAFTPTPKEDKDSKSTCKAFSDGQIQSQINQVVQSKKRDIKENDKTMIAQQKLIKSDEPLNSLNLPPKQQSNTPNTSTLSQNRTFDAKLTSMMSSINYHNKRMQEDVKTSFEVLKQLIHNTKQKYQNNMQYSTFFTNLDSLQLKDFKRSSIDESIKLTELEIIKSVQNLGHNLLIIEETKENIDALWRACILAFGYISSLQ